MSVPKIVKGQYYDVAVENPTLPAGSGDFIVICGLNSRSLTEAYQSAKEYIRDCSDPTMIPFGVVNVTGQDFTVSGTGVHNRAQGDIIRILGGKSVRMRFIEGEPADDAVNHGFYEGNFVLTNRQETAADGTNVTEQFTWDSDGQVFWTTVTGFGDLATLTLSDKTAGEDAGWSSAVLGKTQESVITATSSDGTIISVTGDTVSAVFATTGSKTITMIETLAGATGSPKTSTDTVVVS